MSSRPAKSSPAAPTSLTDLDELCIQEIFSRLPVKTVMQMKCFRKSWKKVISGDSFTKLHLQRSLRNTHLLLLPEWSMPDEGDQNLDFCVVPFPVSSLLENPIEVQDAHRLRNITIPNDDPDYRLKNMDCFQMVGSCNGLICLRDTENQSTCFRLWNPATKTISEKFGHIPNFHRFTFGYDISTETYKMVGIYDNDDLFKEIKNNVNEVKLFSFQDNLWRDIGSFPSSVPFGSYRLDPVPNNGVYVSGFINWLVIKNTTEYEWKNINIGQFVIVSLDLATETYRQLRPPGGFVEVPSVEPCVSVLMDCLCFSYRFDEPQETHFVLWKMMEFGDQESWTPFLQISFQDLQIERGIGISLQRYSKLSLFPLCIFESRNTLIMASNQKYADDDIFEPPQHAIVYNWRDNIVERITTGNDNIMWFYTKDYIESLVSTRQRTTPSASSTSGVIDG